MWITRRADGTINGSFRNRQKDDADHERQEEVADDLPELIAFLNPVEKPRVTQDKAEIEAGRLDATILQLINQSRAEWNTWAGANFPSLTPAERARMGIICWMLSLNTRQLMPR